MKLTQKNGNKLRFQHRETKNALENMSITLGAMRKEHPGNEKIIEMQEEMRKLWFRFEEIIEDKIKLIAQIQ